MSGKKRNRNKRKNLTKIDEHVFSENETTVDKNIKKDVPQDETPVDLDNEKVLLEEETTTDKNNEQVSPKENTSTDKNEKKVLSQGNGFVIKKIERISPQGEKHITFSTEISTPSEKVVEENASSSRSKLDTFPDVTGIVLIMIVKNESKIISRCLDQAKPIISGVCITDTGSTDNCIECIRKWGEKNEIPCQVPVGAFKNFGYSRSLSFRNAQRYFPNASYYLLLDADLNLVIEDDWDISKLTHDGYKIYQQTKTDRYQNIRLIKASKSWVCTGVTHEYWECKGSNQSLLHTLWIDDKDDGGCKQDKYSRDKRLLLEGIANKKTPKDLKARYRFYLAQTHFCMKDFNSSIEEYQRRIDIGGWDEEVWYSQLQIGKAYMASDRQELGVTAMLKAWDKRPRRSEPLQIIAKYYREKKMNRIAYHFAKMAYDQGYPMGDSLFIDSPTYKYLIDLELSINAFYVGKKEIGCQSHQRLKSIYKELPSWVQSCVDNNDKFYLC